MVAKSKYTMRISLNVIQHLGIGLYSNIPAVLSETVANAWDADATEVSITIDKKQIVIQDNGCGMTIQDANEKYLNVGYERRKKQGDKTPKFNRLVMGRKGIGKLSLFSIANTVTVTSVSKGKPHGFLMDVNKIKKAAEKSGEMYNPESIKITKDLKRGTRIVLTSLRHVGRPAVLKRRLARRFNVIRNGNNFSVKVNGEDITAQDTGYYRNLEYVWGFGDKSRDIISNVGGIQDLDYEPKVKCGNQTVKLDGWIGTMKKPGQLKDQDTKESINRITVMIRGKVAQEDILEGLGDASIYSKYVVGEIYADFLDRNDGEDIATTSRQQIMEDAPDYRALLESVKKILRHIGSKWTNLRNQAGEKAALEIPEIKKWFDELLDHKEAAKKLFGKIHMLPIDDDDEKRQIFVSGILAFESLKFKNMLNKLEEISVGDLPALTKVFSQLDDLEASAYYQTIKNRLKIINKLSELTNQNAKEKIIQQYLFDHLWLLDPSWERVSSTEVMEKGIKKAFDAIDIKLPQNQKKSRLDIKYRTTGNKHIIIELKNPKVTVSTGELIEQIEKYTAGVNNALKGLGKENEPVEFICVLGRSVKNWDDVDVRKKSERSLREYSARIVMYDELIQNAQAAYREYTDNKKKVSRVYKLITSITDKDRKAISPS